MTDPQFGLLLLAGVWTARIFLLHRENGIRRVTLVVTANLLVNLAFFMSHLVFTPYYTVPIAMLSLWTSLFASLMQPSEAVDRGPGEQAASARS